MASTFERKLADLFRSALCRSKPLVDLLEANPRVRSAINALLINQAVALIPPRPNPFSTLSSYTSWDSLIDRTYSGRHLPAESNGRPLPGIEEVAGLFRRPGAMKPSTKSTVLFTYFAQWFTDSFLRTARKRPSGSEYHPDRPYEKKLEYDDRLKNNSTHDIDLCNLYGLKWNIFGEPVDDVDRLRSHESGKLKSQWINGEEFPPFYFDAGSGRPASEFAGLSMTDSMPIARAMLKYHGRAPEDGRLFVMAGERLNSQVGFAAMNTLFLREHNRICDLLRGAYPQWGADDERLFQTARNINIAVLGKIVIEEYINHISPLLFRLRLEPGRFEDRAWYRINWMTIEFNLLYRWHSLVPDTYRINLPGEGGALRLEDVPLDRTMFDNAWLIRRGLGGLLEDASRQTAGEIGLFNTPATLMPAEWGGIELGRMARLPGYNAYRELATGRKARDFAELSPDPEVQGRLKDLYKTVDQVEFYPGLFAEPVEANSALAPPIGILVAVDAFSQALTNPLLSRRIFNESTFTKVGLDVLASTSTLSDLLHRNLGPDDRRRYFLSMTRVEAELRDGPPPAGAGL